jgi:hypothetical protein
MELVSALMDGPGINVKRLNAKMAELLNSISANAEQDSLGNSVKSQLAALKLMKILVQIADL